MKLLDKMKVKAQGISVPHGRDIPKPNEDKLLIDEERGIFIVLDGVTRPHEEYIMRPGESSALDLGNLFLDEAYGYILNNIENSDVEAILRGAVKAGNRRLRDYDVKSYTNDWTFYPSTLGIISILRDGVLHYVSAGDCIAVLIRRNAKMLFGREWTLEAVDKLNVTKQERYASYCNHPGNHLSYTVFNGGDEVMSGLGYSFIDIHEGDVLFIASDGIGDYIKYEKIGDLISQSPDEIIARSGKYDIPPYATYADDKTLIKLML